MNFLAHLALAEENAESLIGNLAGDFVKGRVDESLPEGIRRGIVEHRHIDSFTDTHPIAGEFRRIIAADHGHYAKVIADMFFDHFLAVHFERLHGESLRGFLTRTFAIMDPHQGAMPGRLRDVYPRMRDGRWFESYREIDGIHVALTNLSHRLSRRPHLEEATPLLRTAREPLQALFAEFYPQLQAFARSLR
jgi:acyl carrier protein phosphodiesterase